PRPTGPASNAPRRSSAAGSAAARHTQSGFGRSCGSHLLMDLRNDLEGAQPRLMIVNHRRDHQLVSLGLCDEGLAAPTHRIARPQYRLGLGTVDAGLLHRRPETFGTLDGRL